MDFLVRQLAIYIEKKVNCISRSFKDVKMKEKLQRF